MTPVVLTLPLKTVSEINMCEHWRVKHRRRKSLRGTTSLVVAAHLAGKGIEFPLVVAMTRIAPSDGLDNDNLQSSCKSVRDGVADALGIDDSDPRVTWRPVEQRRGKSYAIEIRLEPCA